MSNLFTTQFFQIFALELGPKGIRVNSVQPTVVNTDMGKIGWSHPERAAWILNRSPSGRFAEVKDILNPVMFLLSDNSDMINGHHLPADGGFLSA